MVCFSAACPAWVAVAVSHPGHFSGKDGHSLHGWPNQPKEMHATNVKRSAVLGRALDGAP